MTQDSANPRDRVVSVRRGARLVLVNSMPLDLATDLKEWLEKTPLGDVILIGSDPGRQRETNSMTSHKKPGVAFWAIVVPWGFICIVGWATWPKFAKIATDIVEFVWNRMQ